MSDPMSPTPPPTGGQPPAGGGYAPPPAPQRPGLPWDRAKDFSTLIETIKRVITAPKQAYAEMQEKGDYVAPLLFALVFIVLGAIVQAVWQIIGIGGSTAWLDQMGELDPQFQEMMAEYAAVSAGSAVMGIFTSLIAGLIGLFLISGIFHLMLMLLGALKDSSAGFEGSFRVVSYAQVVQLAALVPFFGGLLALVWAIILYTIGLASVHRTTQGKAVAAVLIPFVVCCVCILIAVFALMGTIMAALGAAAGAN